MTAHFNNGRPLGLLVKMFPKLSETFILEEVLGLESLGVPMRLYALRAPTDTIVHAAVAQVRAGVTLVPQWTRGHRIEIAARHLRLFATAPLRYLRAAVQAGMCGRNALQDFAQAGWLAVQLRDDGIAHLHAHFISMPADVAVLVSKLVALPFSISAHAKDIYLSKATDLRRKLEAARFTVTCTEYNRTTLAAVAPQAAVYRMYHGVDHALFHPRPHEGAHEPPLILSVGRLRAKKGLDTLIDACRLLCERGQAFRCEIIGYGEQAQSLQAHIARLGLNDLVKLTGKLPREQVIEAYAGTAVYVQPSRVAADGDRDGIPNVLLEAMAMGLPVVATNVSGIPELVRDADNGLLVAANDAAALANAISRVLRDPPMRDRLGRRARETVTAAFDNQRNLRLLCDLLHHHGALQPSKHPLPCTPLDEHAQQAPAGAK